MRERTTWDRNEIAKQAARPKTADPYLMNQDHVKVQPPADKYVTGDPSSFGEDIHPATGTWEAEYSGGAVKRNEIGMPEMRNDTFNHAEKTASEDVLVKKAQLCVRVSRLMLPKTATVEAVEDQGLALMHLPDADLINTFNRLAQEDQQQQAQGQGQAQQQTEQKQAGEMPPQFKENAEKKKEEAAEKKDEGQGQQKQASDHIAAAVTALQTGNPAAAKIAIQAAIQMAAQQMVAKQANDAAQVAPAAVAPAAPPVAQSQPAAPAAVAAPAVAPAAAPQAVQANGQQPQQQMAQMDQQAQMQQQMAQMVQEAAQQQMQQQAQGQQPQQQMAQGQQPQQQMAQGQQPQQQMADDQLLDAMLADMPTQQPTAEVEVELDAPSMDTGDAVLGPEDAQLMQLFANDEAQQAQQAQDQGQQQQKQAASGSIRTASTRTVGARPTQGVSRIGGTGTPSKGGGVDLSSMWNSAPDVSGVFGIPKS